MAAACASLIAAPAAAVVAKATPAKQTTSLARVAFNKAEATVAVSNVGKTNEMLVWEPENNKYFETFSYLPPLDATQISKQVDYITSNGWIPCLEFALKDQAYVASDNCIRINNTTANYADNRYWTMYKLPMFGCTDSSQVLKEIENCNNAFPDSYVRLVAFDNVRQVQCISFLVHRPAGAVDYRPTDKRSR